MSNQENFPKSQESQGYREARQSQEMAVLTIAVALGAGVITNLSFINAIDQFKIAKTQRPFELVRMDGDKIIIKQDGKEFAFTNADISPDSRAKLEKAYPKFASFLKSGPINIPSTGNANPENK